MIPDKLIAQVLEKSDMVTIISGYVTLEQAGSNWRGFCPFHPEKKPLFTVSPDKGIYKCFGCKKGGNLIRFIMEIEKKSFPDAVHFLARKAGLEPAEANDNQNQPG